MLLPSFLEKHQFTPTGPTVVEGYAQRVRISDRDGHTWLLYQFNNPHIFQRVATISQNQAYQLFAVPDAHQTFDDALVVLVHDIEGQPLSTLLEAQGLRLDQLPTATSTMEQAGTLLRKLHSLGAPSDCFGDLLEDGPRRRTFNGYVASRLEVFQEALHSSFEELQEEQRHQLLGSLGDLRHELSAFHPRYPSSIVHGAVALEHIWVNDRGEVVGLTGFDHAAYLPPEIDMAMFLWVGGLVAHERLVQAFYRGYGAARTMDVQRRERFYRRLAAFEALLGYRAGHTAHSLEDLLWMTTPAVGLPPGLS